MNFFWVLWSAKTKTWNSSEYSAWRRIANFLSGTSFTLLLEFALDRQKNWDAQNSKVTAENPRFPETTRISIPSLILTFPIHTISTDTTILKTKNFAQNPEGVNISLKNQCSFPFFCYVCEFSKSKSLRFSKFVKSFHWRIHFLKTFFHDST